MKVALAVVDGFGVRNFIHGRLAPVLTAGGHEVVVISGLPADHTRRVCARLGDLPIIEMPIYRDSLAAGYCRRVTELAHSMYHDTEAMRYMRSRMQLDGYSREVLYKRIVRWHARRQASHEGLLKMEAAHERVARKSPLVAWYRSELERSSPDVLLVSHQRPPQMIPLVLAARDLGIPTATFIFSWDNLTSKGRMPVRFDHYLLWSDLMRSEMRVIYPDVEESSLHVVGAPQFEPYVYDEYVYDAGIFAEHGIRDDERVLLYTCGDMSASPNDDMYIGLIAEENRNGGFGERVRIVVRPSPADEITRFAEVMGRYPEVTWLPPIWSQTRTDHPEPWSQRMPEYHDTIMLKSLMMRMTAGVNVASTITLDASVFDKPIVNPALGGTAEYPSLFFDGMHFEFEHYKTILGFGSVDVARSRGELIERINDVLRNPDQRREGRAAMLRGEVHLPLRGTSERMVHALESIQHAGPQR